VSRFYKMPPVRTLRNLRHVLANAYAGPWLVFRPGGRFAGVEIDFINVTQEIGPKLEVVLFEAPVRSTFMMRRRIAIATAANPDGRKIYQFSTDGIHVLTVKDVQVTISGIANDSAVFIAVLGMELGRTLKVNILGNYFEEDLEGNKLFF